MGLEAEALVFVGDKEYYSDENRLLAKAAGAISVISYRKNRKTIPERFAMAMLRWRRKAV